jgi:hypothetical protein
MFRPRFFRASKEEASWKKRIKKCLKKEHLARGKKFGSSLIAVLALQLFSNET